MRASSPDIITLWLISLTLPGTIEKQNEIHRLLIIEAIED